MRCNETVGHRTRPGIVVLPKGLWRRHTANGYGSAHTNHAACHDKPLHGESIEMKPGPMRWLVLAALLLVLVITTTSAYIRLSQAVRLCGLACLLRP